MDFTGSLRAADGQDKAAPKARPMSYEFRAGQVERQLAISGECTIYDLAKHLQTPRRQIHNICDRMAREGRITVRQVPHRPNMFKHLISRR